MAGFKATAVISKMSYDFSGIAVDDEEVGAMLDKAKGVTPEPSGAQVRHFQQRQKEILGLAPDTPIADLNLAMQAKTEDELLEMDEDIMDIVAEVTSGKPSRDVLAALPFRVREAYYGHIVGELSNFLAGNATIRRSLATVPNG